MLARWIRLFFSLFLLYIFITLLDAALVKKRQFLFIQYSHLRENKMSLQVQYQNRASLQSIAQRAGKLGMKSSEKKEIVQ